MKNIAYLLTAFSCILLSMQLYGKGKIIFAVAIFGVSIFYLWKIFYKGRKEDPVRHEKNMAAAASGERKDAVRQELEHILAHCRRNRNITRNASISLLIVATAVLFINTPLGIALYMFLVPLAYLFYKNQKAVTMIERGL